MHIFYYRENISLKVLLFSSLFAAAQLLPLTPSPRAGSSSIPKPPRRRNEAGGALQPHAELEYPSPASPMPPPTPGSSSQPLLLPPSYLSSSLSLFSLSLSFNSVLQDSLSLQENPLLCLFLFPSYIFFTTVILSPLRKRGRVLCTCRPRHYGFQTTLLPEQALRWELLCWKEHLGCSNEPSLNSYEFISP